MTSQSASAAERLLELAGLRPLNTYGVRNIAAVMLGLCPPVICALIAGNTGNWDLFERSGSLTAAIGLLMASRRYVQHGALELAMLQASDELKYEMVELLEDVSTAKVGLALSGFGMIISGWGKYLGWWSFGYLLVWALFAIRDIRRDFVHLQKSKASM